MIQYFPISKVSPIGLLLITLAWKNGEICPIWQHKKIHKIHKTHKTRHPRLTARQTDGRLKSDEEFLPKVDAKKVDRRTGGQTDRYLESDEALLPGAEARQVDLAEGLVRELQVDAIGGHRELERHRLVGLRHGTLTITSLLLVVPCCCIITIILLPTELYFRHFRPLLGHLAG